MEPLSPETSSGGTERRLLQSIVTVARHIYGAAASSVFMVSPQTGELVFAAVAGQGQQELIGMRFAPGTGIAGWVAASGQTLIADNVGETDQFARDAASSTGYLPNSIMAAPLIADGECIGVLEVLDRHVGGQHRDFDDMDLLGLLATQSALSLSLLHRSRRTPLVTAGLGGLISRLTEHAATDRVVHDPLAVALLGVSLDLLDRSGTTSSLVG